MLKIRDTDKARRDKTGQSNKLLQIEQTYHYQSKKSLNNATAGEVTVLKQQILRERSALHELESVYG